MSLFGLISGAPPSPLLQGEGLYLRPATSADFVAWVGLREASRNFLKPWEPSWPLDDLTRVGFRRRLRRQQEEMARDESYAFLIFAAGANELLGGVTIGALRRGAAQSATLGYWMGAAHAGKGHMTRAVRRIVGFGFTDLGLHRIEAACIPENIASQCLLKRNSFVREGLARSYLCIDGAWRDHILFARIAGHVMQAANDEGGI